MADLSIRIRQHQFTFPSRYHEGTVLTRGEARALNSLMAENIRNNVDLLVTRQLELLAEGRVLSQESHEELQRQILDYATRYEFLDRVVSRHPKGPIERELRALAALRAQALGLMSNHPEWDAELTRLEGLPELQRQARAQVEARNLEAQEALQELLQGDL